MKRIFGHVVIPSLHSLSPAYNSINHYVAGRRYTTRCYIVGFIENGQMESAVHWCFWKTQPWM